MAYYLVHNVHAHNRNTSLIALALLIALFLPFCHKHPDEQ